MPGIGQHSLAWKIPAPVAVSRQVVPVEPFVIELAIRPRCALGQAVPLCPDRLQPRTVSWLGEAVPYSEVRPNPDDEYSRPLLR